MCPNKDWFETHRLYERGTDLMGNNIVCKAIGIGTVKIKMFNGVVGVMGNVMKNLISLGA